VNVAFVNYHDFTSNSAVHIFNLANELVDLGCACAVCVPNGVETIQSLGTPRFEPVDFRTATRHGLRFPGGGPPTLIHAWTPREIVRTTTEELAARYACPFFVHLEDNEEVVAAQHLGLSVEQLRVAPPDGIPRNFSHPARSQAFLTHAAGVSVIIDRLLEFVPAETPTEVIWPAFEPELFGPVPPDPPLRAELGIPDGCSVVVYPGNAHAANADEMRSLYLAVAAVNRVRPLKLVRLGRDFYDFLGGIRATVERHVIRVDLQPRARVGDYVRLADVLVQPGRSDPFNDYRFPSKLPEFLATGRPVILPNANIGRYLRNEEECILLNDGDALEIAAAVERLLADAVLRERVGRAGRAFATANFSWRGSARRLERFYERALDRLTSDAPASLAASRWAVPPGSGEPR
jgi:glycosyltransferase involved in cell wall biosynthesis